jgi:hypothetical protein
MLRVPSLDALVATKMIEATGLSKDSYMGCQVILQANSNACRPLYAWTQTLGGGVERTAFHEIDAFQR